MTATNMCSNFVGNGPVPPSCGLHGYSLVSLIIFKNPILYSFFLFFL